MISIIGIPCLICWSNLHKFHKMSELFPHDTAVFFMEKLKNIFNGYIFLFWKIIEYLLQCFRTERKDVFEQKYLLLHQKYHSFWFWTKRTPTLIRQNKMRFLNILHYFSPEKFIWNVWVFVYAIDVVVVIVKKTFVSSKEGWTNSLMKYWVHPWSIDFEIFLNFFW